LERAAAQLAVEGSKVEAVESTEATLSALEVIPSAIAEATTAQLEKLKSESLKSDQQPKLQVSLVLLELPWTTNILAANSRRGRRMARVLDAVMKPSKVATLAPTRVSEDKIEELGEAVTASASPAYAQAGPSKTKPIEQVKEILAEKLTLLIPEMVSAEDLDFIIRHASGKQLTQRQIAEAQYYTKELKYPRGSLVYKGDEENEFLYCLPDNKEINVCREMMDKMGYPKLELGLSLMLKDHLADNLAYNSLKVCVYYSS
jgi:hypothetical protein